MAHLNVLDEQCVAAYRTHVTPDNATVASDVLAREEPLEIRLGTFSLAVLMRTPGHDAELVRGFLLSEGVVSCASDIATVRHCDAVQRPEDEDNVMLVTLAPHVHVSPERFRRNFFASSSCGVCGKAQIDTVLASQPGYDAVVAPSLAVLHRALQQLQQQQPLFAATGGVHGAGVFAASGDALCVREDVGRHNALDKLIGWVSLQDDATRTHAKTGFVVVSGRLSFELVQKTLAARMAGLIGVSAPTSLAVELAARSNLFLAGFLRPNGVNIYVGAQ